MERYHYDLLDRAYAIFDRQRGYGDKYHPDANRLAVVYDHEVAQRLVHLGVTGPGRPTGLLGPGCRAGLAGLSSGRSARCW